MCCAPFAALRDARVSGSHRGATKRRSSHSKLPHARATAPTFPAFLVPTSTTVTSRNAAGGSRNLPRCDWKSRFVMRPPEWVSRRVSANRSRDALSPRRLCRGASSPGDVAAADRRAEGEGSPEPSTRAPRRALGREDARRQGARARGREAAGPAAQGTAARSMAMCRRLRRRARTKRSCGDDAPDRGRFNAMIRVTAIFFFVVGS